MGASCGFAYHTCVRPLVDSLDSPLTSETPKKNKNSVASGDVTMMDAKGTTPHPLNAKYEHLTISILTENPHVVVVLLNRPRKRNAINAKVRHVVGAAGDDATSF